MSVVEMKVPTIGESITEVTLSQWLKKDGDYVKLDEPICEFESDKATLEFPAEASGKLIYVAKEGDDLSIGSLVARIDTSVQAPDAASGAQSVASSATPTPTATSAAVATSSAPGGHPSPAAAKIMREGDVNPANVSGSGKDGRITKEDAAKAVENRTVATPATPTAVAQPSVAPTPKPVVIPGARSERVEKMSRMRRTIAARLVSAKNQTAMLTTFNEVDMTGIIQLREK
jgi:2-oxoglutarate dehydrogenase E2 component (dihydrolipoamide succinyltransferase)